MTTARHDAQAGAGAPPIGRRLRPPRDPRRRRGAILLVAYLAAFAMVAAQLVRVQVVQADRYADRSIQQRARTVALPATRGRLYDREGGVLATSVDAATIFADPRVFRPTESPRGATTPAAGDARATAAALAPLLGVDAGELLRKLRSDRHFVYLARQLDWELGERIMALELPGVGRLTEPRRVYPNERLAGQLLGFTNLDGVGAHGLELQHDDLLRGEPGELSLERSSTGLTITSALRELSPPSPGGDLVLTIDREIQSFAEHRAAQAVEELNAVGAAVVVLDVAEGDVLAMASVPSLDPNAPGDADPSTWRNRAITDVFEPGSVQKAITAAAAIEAGVVTPSTGMTVDDRLRVGPKVFSDSHDHPTEHMSFAEIMETSSNVGTILVGQRLGEQRLHAALREFGYGDPLGLGFPGASGGLLMPVDQWWVTSLPTISIGQGVAVTLLQLASFYGTLANDGVAVAPRLLRGQVGDDGRLRPADASPTRRVVSGETATAVQRMLRRVVHGERGTGKAAAVPGFEVAGKTGTARKPAEGARGYSGEYIASFVGFAPADDPQIVVAVMVDEPRPIWGGVAAAPVFADVMGFALSSRNVQPSGELPPVDEALVRAEARAAEAEAAARQEGPGTDPSAPGSPPVGAPAGGDGTSVAEEPPADSAEQDAEPEGG